MRMMGRGREALRMFCAIMDIPEPTYSRACNSHCAALHKAVLEEATKSMKSAEELLAKGEGNY